MYFAEASHNSKILDVLFDLFEQTKKADWPKEIQSTILKNSLIKVFFKSSICIIWNIKLKFFVRYIFVD